MKKQPTPKRCPCSVPLRAATERAAGLCVRCAADIKGDRPARYERAIDDKADRREKR